MSSECVHRWNCDLVPAVCQKCGDRRTFNPPEPYTAWNGLSVLHTYGSRPQYNRPIVGEWSG